MMKHNYTLAQDYLFEYLAQEKSSIKSILLFAMTGNLLLLSIPFFIQIVLQQFSILIFQQSTFFLILIIFFSLIGIAILRMTQTHISERLQRRVFLFTLNKISQPLNNITTHQEKSSLNHLNYLNEGVTLQKNLIHLIIDGANLFLQAIIVVLLISIYHPFFILYSILLLAAIFGSIIFLAKPAFNSAMAESDSKYELMNQMQNLSLSPTSPEVAKVTIDNLTTDYFLKREAAFKIYFKQSIIILLIKVIASILLISAGGLLIINNQMSIGQLFASELLITSLLISLFKLTSLLDYWYSTLISFYKINKQIGTL